MPQALGRCSKRASKFNCCSQAIEETQKQGGKGGRCDTGNLPWNDVKSYDERRAKTRDLFDETTENYLIGAPGGQQLALRLQRIAGE
jgi:hypothetical protein